MTTIPRHRPAPDDRATAARWQAVAHIDALLSRYGGVGAHRPLTDGLLELRTILTEGWDR